MKANIRFGKDPEDANAYVLCYQDTPSGPDIMCIHEEDYWCDVTSCVPYVPVEANEIILDHNLAEDFVDALTKYLGGQRRRITFGGFNTATSVIKLAPNWKDLCIPQEVLFGDPDQE